MSNKRWLSWVCLLTGLLSASSFAFAGQYLEDFTSSTFEDSENTSAEWDTAAGELRLPTFALEIQGSYDTAGSAFGVAVDRDIAYVGDGGQLHCIDTSDPGNLQLLGSYTSAGQVARAAVHGSLVLLAAGNAGLEIVDVSDPGTPSLVGSLATWSNANHVTVAGNLAYVSDSAGLVVIDITDPTSPAYVGGYSTTQPAHSVAVAGDVAFVAGASDGLLLFDVSDPTNPLLIASHPVSGYSIDVFVSGNQAYVANLVGFEVVDVSDPANPSPTGAFASPGDALSIVVDGDLAYVSDGAIGGLLMVDVSDPANPTLVDSYDTPDTAYHTAISGNLAFVADRNDGLHVIAVGDPSTLILTGSYSTGSDLYVDLAVDGNLLYVADRSGGSAGGLRVFDVTDPSIPTLVSSHPLAGSTWRVAVDGDLVFVADGNNMYIVDVGDPALPVTLGSYNAGAQVEEIVVSGDFLYAGCSTGGLHVIDIEDPNNPALVGNFPTPRANRVAFAGDLVLVADSNWGLIVVDVSDPTSPSALGYYDAPGAHRGLAVAGTLAFFEANSGMTIVDFSDPALPTPVSILEFPEFAWDIAVSGDLALVTTTSSGTYVVDISDPTDPVILDNHGTPGYSVGTVIQGDHVYIAEQQGGFQVLEIHQREVFRSRDTGQSLALDGVDSDTILRARSTSTETAGMSWELSADNGANWQPMTPDGSWMEFDTPGEDLLWRSTHTWSPGLIPTVSNLEIDWLNEFAPITSITDVPDDQGGLVEIEFTRSGFDFLDETEFPIVAYGIFRRVDDPTLVGRVFAEGLEPTATWRDESALSALDTGRVRLLDEREFVLGSQHGQRGSDFPPGVWEGVGMLFPSYAESYGAAIHTAADSSGAGEGWSVFVTTALTSTPGLFFASHPDSGYSVDNVPPSVPQNLVFGESEMLEWDQALEPDFEYHSVYGSETEIFDETAVLIGHTVDSTFDVSGTAHHYYHVTTSDHVANESDAATIENPTSSAPGGGDVAGTFAFRPAQPNPFTVGTSIGYDLPEAGEVRLRIFDASGRQVCVLIDSHQPAGSHDISWDGTTAGRRRVAPGVYFARIEAEGFEASRRLVVVR